MGKKRQRRAWQPPDEPEEAGRSFPSLGEWMELGRGWRATPHLALCHLISWHRLSSPLFLEPLSLFPQAPPTTEAQDLEEARGTVTNRRCVQQRVRGFSVGLVPSELTERPAEWERPSIRIKQHLRPPAMPPMSYAQHFRGLDMGQTRSLTSRNLHSMRIITGM